MSVDAVILAAGSGDRFGGPTPKQLALLAGQPVLAWAVRAAVAGGVDRIVVVAHPGLIEATTAVAAAAASGRPVTVVAGGQTRSESTRLGLAALVGSPDDIVVVHDAARPLARAELFRRTIAAVVDGGADAATPVVPSSDTIATVDGDAVESILDRARLARVQTPQAFRRRVLVDGHARASAAGDTSATDDGGLVLRHVPGARLVVVPGDERNMKITSSVDLQVAERLLDGGSPE